MEHSGAGTLRVGAALDRAQAAFGNLVFKTLCAGGEQKGGAVVLR